MTEEPGSTPGPDEPGAPGATSGPAPPPRGAPPSAGRGVRPSRAVVVGGGIGGLTVAVALHLRGWQVTVLERAVNLEPVGAGISLAPNALRALDVIGAGDEIRALAAWQGEGGLRTPSGRWLSRSSAEAAAARFGDPLVLLHRATLVACLAARLPEGVVRTAADATLADRGAGDRPATVTAAGDAWEAELVVAADGVHSRVRDALFPGCPGPVYSGLTAWRMVVPAPGPFAPHETWGRGGLWGTQPLKDGRIYAYAAARTPEGGRAPDDERAELLRRFGDWHDPIPAVLDAVRPDGVLRNDVRHMAQPLPAYHRGRVALLGDAVHAMPPTLGQGGNQAIEDAVVLAHHASAGASGLAAYTADRRPRTTALVRKAVGAGRLALLRNGPAVALRNAAIGVLSLAGEGVLLRGFDEIAGWRPPTPPYASRAEDDTSPIP